MDANLTLQILEIIQTMQEICPYLYHNLEVDNQTLFSQFYQDMYQGLARLIRISNAYKGDQGAQKLEAGGRSCLASLIQIYSDYHKQKKRCLQKIEFELLPLLQELYLQFYYYGYLVSHPEKMEEYNQRTIRELCGNNYIDDAVQSGQYTYDLSIIVLAYNKLEYTRQCVESLLSNLPKHLRYELIFINHGSTDGTKEYFSSKFPDKQLDIAVNGGGSGAVWRIVEGEFTVMISNDVVIGLNAIENLYACIHSDPKIAWVVSTTPNISNLQTIPANYQTIEEFQAFTKQNNHQDAFRWEQRVRLCNPIDIRRNSVFYASSGLCLNGRFHSFLKNSFPDDRYSLFLRRNGYKMMLAKDAYCHHFGSVTLSGEVKRQGEQEYYMNGRKEFFHAYGVDPWGTGFCFAIPFLQRVVGNELGHVDVLGINCGLGANSLKIKEQLKEYCHNTDVALYNITDVGQFIDDLKGISDGAELVSNFVELAKFLSQRQYYYIVWEEAFLEPFETQELFQYVKSALMPGGSIFIKKNKQTGRIIDMPISNISLGENWYMIKAE